jgi:hypothetical protein
VSTEVTHDAPPRKEKALTIGAVSKQLEREFPDISISKIRYLEDQKLLAPRRTPGGYRLYAAADGGRASRCAARARSTGSPRYSRRPAPTSRSSRSSRTSA